MNRKEKKVEDKKSAKSDATKEEKRRLKTEKRENKAKEKTLRKDQGKTGKDKEKKTNRGLFLHFSIKDQVYFAKRLSFLIHANVPVLDSLRILQKQTKSRIRKDMFKNIIDDVSNGQSLARSLGKFKKVFGGFAINIIKTGESSGSLDESLNSLADELEKKHRLRRKVFGALIYPALIIVATLGVVGMLTIYVFPKILPIFASLSFELPVTTKILIWFTDFLTAYGLWVLGAFAIIGVTSSILISTQEVAHYVWDRIVLKIPLLGKISLNYQMANLNRTLGLLLKTDTGVVDSFAIASGTTNNAVYARQLKIISDSLIHGESVAVQLSKRPDIFPNLMAEMIAIGEKTGRLSDTFLYLAGLYEEEVDNQTKNLSNSIEPLLMITMGVIVGFIAISIITPIYEVTQNLNP